MARMIPPAIHRSVKSVAERRLFELLPRANRTNRVSPPLPEACVYERCLGGLTQAVP
jgi:hypothetical protein